MKNIFFLSFFLLMALTAHAQLGCSEKFTMRVIAESGLNMRSEPSLSSQVVVTVPYDSTLVTCKNTSGQLTYDQIDGYWRRAIYKGKVGYMFDGFMEIVSLKAPGQENREATEEAPADTGVISAPQETRAEPVKERPKEAPRKYQFVTEAYNFCGDVQKINPGLLWYGFYPADKEEGEEHYRIEPVKLSVVLSRTKLGEGMEFDIETDREERSIFLVGMSRKPNLDEMKIEDKTEMLRYTGRKVFPGQELTLKERRPSVSLVATGSVKSSGPCPELDNYKLVLRCEQHDVEQSLTEEFPPGKCGLPEIYWFGDFTGDGLPEIIFVSVYDEQDTFTLFVSDTSLEDGLVRKEAEWTLKECND